MSRLTLGVSLVNVAHPRYCYIDFSLNKLGKFFNTLDFGRSSVFLVCFGAFGTPRHCNIDLTIFIHQPNYTMVTQKLCKQSDVEQQRKPHLDKRTGEVASIKKVCTDVRLEGVYFSGPQVYE